VEPWNPRRGADYAAMRTAGLTWLRTDLDWRFIEARRGGWDWTVYDPVVRDAAAAGLTTLGILHTVPAWANGAAGDYAPASDPASLTEYCDRTAGHYLRLGVTAYEIGNEINLPAPGRPRPDGVAYTKLTLLPCVDGVRRAAARTGVRATVILGSLVPTDRDRAVPVTFLTDVYAAGGRGHFDAVALHPYTGSDPPGVSDKLTAVPNRLYQVMAAHGDSRQQIWATEFGYPTGGGNAVSEARQRDFVPAALNLWFAHPYAGPLFWYSARDSGTSRSDREEHFGLLRRDGTPKPAYYAVAAWFRK
jgi:polysaccharide biosynthesis protein PslG